MRVEISFIAATGETEHFYCRASSDRDALEQLQQAFSGPDQDLPETYWISQRQNSWIEIVMEMDGYRVNAIVQDELQRSTWGFGKGTALRIAKEFAEYYAKHDPLPIIKPVDWPLL